MLVEGPPGPEGPAVSGTLLTPHWRVRGAGCVRCRELSRGLSTHLCPGCVASMCHACVQSALESVFWSKNKQKALILFLRFL